jgi:multisubunit Na+/H+ antiporter MnhF subunit
MTHVGVWVQPGIAFTTMIGLAVCLFIELTIYGPSWGTRVVLGVGLEGIT